MAVSSVSPSLEEANKLRAQLSLKPLRMGPPKDAPPAEEEKKEEERKQKEQELLHYD